MHARFLPTPTRSVFLFGPRGTGKTTWIRDRFPTAATYDLLDSFETLRLSKNPDVLFRELAALPAGSWAVIDEVQGVPELLNEVHRLIEARGLRFVLSGSSARGSSRSPPVRTRRRPMPRPSPATPASTAGPCRTTSRSSPTR